MALPEIFVSPGLDGLAGPLDNLFLPDGTLMVSCFSNGIVKRYDSSLLRQLTISSFAQTGFRNQIL